MKVPSPEQEPWLMELTEVQERRRIELAGVEVGGERFAALSADEQQRLEEGVLRRLDLETSPARSSLAPRAAPPGARAVRYGWLGGLALAACLLLLVLRPGHERTAELPAFELLPPPADATFRAPSGAEPAALEPEASASRAPSFAVDRELVFTLRPATRVTGSLQVQVFAQRASAGGSPRGAESLLHVPARVSAQPGGAQQVAIDAGQAPLEPGDWRLFFAVGPLGQVPQRAAGEALPLGWQRYEFSLTIERKGK